MIETELGTLRRSHYSNDIDSSMRWIPGNGNGLGFDSKRAWKHHFCYDP